MLPILIACVIWLPALVGLGIPLAGMLRRATGAVVGSVAVRTTLCGLLGMFVASTLAATANFFVAVYPIVATAILAAGWVLAIRNRRCWTRLPRRAWQTAGLILLVVALIDARGLPWYDTGLYHLQAVQWLTHGPVPAGLANLYECLGYNCSWFTLAAAIETPLLLGKSCFVVNGLLAILIALSAVDALLRHRRRHDRILLSLMLIPLAQFGIDVPMISSLAPDPVVILLVIFSITLWIKSARFTAHALMLSCFAVTIKLSASPLLVLALLATVMQPPRKTLGMTVVCVIAACIFLLRGIWLSGYAAYPLEISRIPSLSWTAPPELTLHAAREIAYWSRYTKVFEQVKPGTPWIAAWSARMCRSKPMWIALLLLITGIGLFFHR